MADNEILMTPDNLKSNQFDAAFGNTPHKVYVVYDNLMDELIIKITQPDTLVAEFPISDYYSLLVEPRTLEVVGVQWSEFTKVHLPKFNELNKVWNKRNFSTYFGDYREIEYEPKDMPTQPKPDSYFFIRPEKLANILVTA